MSSSMALRLLPAGGERRDPARAAHEFALARPAAAAVVVTWPLANEPDFWTLITLAIFWYFGRELERMVGRGRFMWLLVLLAAVPGVVATAVDLELFGVRSLELAVLCLFCAQLPQVRFWGSIPAWVFAVVIVGTAGWFFFYAIFAIRVRQNDAFNSITSIFYFVFLFASSMFYPLDPMPQAFRIVAYANPVTWQVDLLRFATTGAGSVTGTTLALEAAAFAAFTLVTFAGALEALRRET